MYESKLESRTIINNLTAQLEQLHKLQKPENPAIPVLNGIRDIFAKSDGIPAQLKYARGVKIRTTSLQTLQESFLSLEPDDSESATSIFSELQQLAKKLVLSQTDRERINTLLNRVEGLKTTSYTNMQEQYTHSMQELTALSKQIADVVMTTDITEPKYTRLNVWGVTVASLLATRSRAIRFPLKYPAARSTYVYEASVGDDLNIIAIRNEERANQNQARITGVANENMLEALQLYDEKNTQLRDPLYAKREELEALLKGI